MAALLIAASTVGFAFSSCKSDSKNENQSKQTEEVQQTKEVQVNSPGENVLANTAWVAETDYTTYLLTFTESIYEWRDIDSGELMDSGAYTIEGSLVHLVRQDGEFTDIYTLEGDELSIGANEDYKLFKKTPVG